MQSMISKQVLFFGQQCILSCDAKCEKAWGNNNRPRVTISDDDDDYAYLADGELTAAPDGLALGIYEGGDPKPDGKYHKRLNRWCCRECERHVLAAPGEDYELPDFSQRLYNKPPHTW
jgi:hypothetical protein